MVMQSFSRWAVAGVSMLGLNATAIALMPVISSNQTAAIAAPNASGNFPDTQNYWAQPFIQVLTERNILQGYPDGTFRPEQPVARDEFAAIIRQAFNQNPERRIASGSVYDDVPEGYWAAPAIQEAYEMGFMRGYPDGNFRPNQPVTRAEALTSLVTNLDLRRAIAENQPENQTATNNQATANQNQAQSTPNQRARRQIFFPLASLGLMQPLKAIQAVANPPAQAAPTGESQPSDPATGQNQAAPRPTASAVVNQYYSDANQIPQYAVASVATATRSGLVVNHPDLRVLKPTEPTTRGEMAAFIHQSLVGQGRLNPLPDNVGASNYVVTPDRLNNTQAQR